METIYPLSLILCLQVGPEEGVSVGELLCKFFYINSPSAVLRPVALLRSTSLVRARVVDGCPVCHRNAEGERT